MCIRDSSNPELVNQLHAMGIQAAFWTVDTQDAVRSLLPLGPDLSLIHI